MDQNSAQKRTVLALLDAFKARDISSIERLLDPNFRDLRKSYGEMSRFEYLRALEILFAALETCRIDLLNLVSENDTVAAEIEIHMIVNGKSVDVALHDLFFFEDNRIIALHEYGDEGL